FGIDLVSQNGNGNQRADHRGMYDHRRCSSNFAVVVSAPDALDRNRARSQFEWGKLLRKKDVTNVLFQRLKERSFRLETEVRHMRRSRSACRSGLRLSRSDQHLV